MNTTERRPGGREAGFTLVELLAVIGILGIIGYALTESVILGLRTTRSTAARVSGAAAVETVASYFTADVHSAEQVLATDDECAPAGTPVLLHLLWTVDGNATTVTYALEPPGGEDQDLVRYACRPGTSTPDRRVLGVINADPSADPPASVLCDGGPCPSDASAAQPATVTLTIRGDTASLPVELTVRRRAP